MTTIRTRFAPSPTGFLHIGGLRTALYAYAFAKSQDGRFILRIEDTDQKRFVPGSIEKIYEVLKLFGLTWDEGPFIQSERNKTGLYQKYAQKLVDENHAYYCFCPSQSKEELEEDHLQGVIKNRDVCRDLSLEEAKKRLEKGEKPAIRLRVPEDKTISFTDFVIKKTITWETQFVDEVMLLKSDGFPTYHLAAMVDDFEMKISHVIRGRDWLASTPAHLLIIDYLGFPRPEMCHLTDILDPEGGKLSKRKGTVSCEGFLSEGYLPQALLNFIMLLGWAPKDNREFFTLPEFVDNFQKGDLQIANPVFNRQKLDWFNGEYIRQLPVVDLNSKFQIRNSKLSQLENKKQIEITKLVQERITKLSDLESLAGFLWEKPIVTASLFGDLDYKSHLSSALEVLALISSWTNQTIQDSLMALIKDKGWKTGDFFMSFRIGLSGSKFTPPITNCAEILGKQETLERLTQVVHNN